MAKKTEENVSEIVIARPETRTVDFWVMGDSPLIMNTMSFKSKTDLLIPKGRKTAAEKATILKHDPLAEYKASMYKYLADDKPTKLCFPSPAFKKGMLTAALDIPGVHKSELGRQIRVLNYSVDIYGIPKMFMSVVRSADKNKTPDVRTRALLEQWCCKIVIEFPFPRLNPTTVANLLISAGKFSGVGDWRQEKGSGSYGCYHIVENPEEIKDLIANAGCKAQLEAIEKAERYDSETEELWNFYLDEKRRRGK